jgi:diguanylate cyclase (GGDEF)-like protein
MPYIQSQQQREGQGLSGGWGMPQSSPVGVIEPEVDPLTGLPGLKGFYRIGTPMVADCLARGIGCAIAIVDIDHFHRVNDTHCEKTGNAVLKALATKLHTVATAGRYLVARLGEEEFGLLLVDLDGAASTKFCEDLRQAIALAPIQADDVELAITVSVGVAEVYGHETFDNYLNAAEQFLFMAKSNGRNQVFSDHTIVMMAAA